MEDKTSSSCCCCSKGVRGVEDILGWSKTGAKEGEERT